MDRTKLKGYGTRSKNLEDRRGGRPYSITSSVRRVPPEFDRGDDAPVAKKKRKAMQSESHPGFKTVQDRISKKQGVSKKRAGAILASATRKAGKAARKANPRLNRVKGY